MIELRGIVLNDPGPGGPVQALRDADLQVQALLVPGF